MQKSSRLLTWWIKITHSLQQAVAVTGSKKCSQTPKLLQNILNEETKSKYVVQFGLTPFVKDELITDAQKTPYSFIFDGTANS